MSDRMASLRKYLSGNPTDSKWFQIVELFNKWPDDDELPLALDYADSHLSAWPDQMRSMYEPTPSHPIWPLVRSISQYLEPRDLTKKKVALLRNVLHLGVSEMKKSKFLSALTHLKSLGIALGPYDEITGLTGLTNLESLLIGSDWEKDYIYYEIAEWSCLSDLTDISPISTLTGLKELSLIGFQNIETYEPINELVELESLTLDACHIESLEVLSGLKKLKRLSLAYSPIARLDGIEALVGLRDLSLFECPYVESFEPLSQLPKLKRINVEGCRAAVSLRGLEHMSDIRTLSLRRMDKLHDISLLEAFHQLKRLDLAYAVMLEDAKPLRGLDDLQELDLRNCTRLKVMPKRKFMRDRDEVAKYQKRL